jgi:antitoxin (DNA-binding transcriptional repressor) of toxin-antitoxin stability system
MRSSRRTSPGCTGGSRRPFTIIPSPRLVIVHDGFRALAGTIVEQPALRNQIQSDNLIVVKTLSVTDVARNFSAVLDDLERDQEEVVLVRNQRQIARLVPEASHQDALSVFGDLYRTLDDETAEALSATIASHRKGRRGRVSELRNPWAG